jgi:DNA mismatch repair protein MutS2
VGVAGSSSGLEIARRFGIPDQIIDAASERVSTSSLHAGEYLRRIKREAEDAATLRAALEEERRAVAEKFASLDRQAQRRERERQNTFDAALRRTIDEFEQRARALVSSIQDRAERVRLERETQKRTAELKRESQRAGKAALGSETEKLLRPVRVMRDGQLVERGETAERSKPAEQPASGEIQRYKPVAEEREIKVGDRVRLRAFGSIGIVDQLKDDEAEVRVKALRFRERLENLELVEEVPQGKVEAGKFARLRDSSRSEVHLKVPEEAASSELNVIGQTTDQAVEAVDKFLDKAALASLSQVRIVHGHGTGALRRAIGELLQGHPHVARFAAAPPQHGGGGATIVELSQ